MVNHATLDRYLASTSSFVKKCVKEVFQESSSVQCTAYPIVRYCLRDENITLSIDRILDALVQTS